MFGRGRAFGSVLLIAVLLAGLLGTAYAQGIAWRETTFEVTLHPDERFEIVREGRLVGSDFGEVFVCRQSFGAEFVHAEALEPQGVPWTAFTQPCLDDPVGTEFVVRFERRVEAPRVRFVYREPGRVLYIGDDLVEVRINLLDDAPDAPGVRVAVTLPSPLRGRSAGYLEVGGEFRLLDASGSVLKAQGIDVPGGAGMWLVLRLEQEQYDRWVE